MITSIPPLSPYFSPYFERNISLASIDKYRFPGKNSLDATVREITGRLSKPIKMNG